MKAKLLTFKQVRKKKLGEFLWIEFPPKSQYSDSDEAEVFHLRFSDFFSTSKGKPLSFGFALPRHTIMLRAPTYGYAWRIWSECPTIEQEEETPWLTNEEGDGD